MSTYPLTRLQQVERLRVPDRFESGWLRAGCVESLGELQVLYGEMDSGPSCAVLIIGLECSATLKVTGS